MTTTQSGLRDVDLEAQSLGDELALALTPRMLRSLLETVRTQPASCYVGPSEPHLRIARSTVGEWRRWRDESCRPA